MLGTKALMREENNMTMPCGNTQAEIDRDTDTDQAERTRFDERENFYTYCLNRLLSGKKVYTFSAVFDLKERMADRYAEFSEFVDCDFDFMHYYKVGELEKRLSNLIEFEARVLASIAAE